MTNEQRLREAFADALAIEIGLVVDDLRYNTIKEWDSVAHMTLVAALEEAFDVMLDTDDIIEMSSVARAREILARHDVLF
jgi:acyl carrier protein